MCSMGARKKLTSSQREFMEALHKALADRGAPVSIPQIRVRSGKSDSRVRSCLKVLIKSGWVRCVGKTKVKKFVPSMLWLEEIDADVEFDSSDTLACIGGKCQGYNCDKLAEDYWRGGYYCRDCMIGTCDETDLRQRFLDGATPKSSAGQLIDEMVPLRSSGDLSDLEMDLPGSDRKKSKK